MTTTKTFADFRNNVKINFTVTNTTSNGYVEMKLFDTQAVYTLFVMRRQGAMDLIYAEGFDIDLKILDETMPAGQTDYQISIHDNVIELADVSNFHILYSSQLDPPPFPGVDLSAYQQIRFQTGSGTTIDNISITHFETGDEHSQSDVQSSSSKTSSENSQSDESPKEGLPTYALILIIVSSILFVAGLGALVSYFLWKRFKKTPTGV